MVTTASLEHPRLPDVSFPIVGEAGDPLVSRDFGKPHLDLYESGRLDPIPQSDQWNGLENYTVSTVLTSSTAYDDARNLADLIKSPQAGTATTFKPNLPAYDSAIDVVGQGEQEEALTLTYPPGTTDYVEVELGLTRVGRVLGDDFGDRATTPTADGSGPIEIRGQSDVVELGTGLTVERAVGRPKSPLQRQSGGTHPFYIEKRKSAYDVFGIEFTATATPTSTVTDLLSLFRTRTGRDTPTLDFNGQYGMGAFSVQLVGSAAFRHVDRAGNAGTIVVPRPDLRVVSDD